MESAMESQAAPPPESEDPQNAETEDDVLLSKAQKLMAKITSSPANPNPNVLHSLASMLETQESRYVQDLGQSSFNNGRASHNIGKLGSAVRENDEFFELISSKFLSESRYSVSVRSAAARVLLSCSTTWMYPHVFEDAVLENIKQWVMDDAARVSGDECNGKLKLRRNKSFDSDMFRTYATGLLALALDGGGQVVEDVLTSGLSAKLMRYLRTRVLGETNTSQKDISYLSESKHASGPTCVRSREESRSRFRQVLDATHVDGPRTGDDGVLDDHNAERDHDRSISIRQVRGEECWVDGEESLKSREFADGSTEVVGMYEVDGEDVDLIGEDRGVGDLRDGKAKVGDRFGMNRPMRDEDADENVRDESTRRRAIRGWARMRGKGRIHEGVAENERTLASPGTGLRSGGQGRSIRDRNLSKNADIKRLPDAKKYPSGTADDVSAIEREDNDDRFIECKVGTKDISDLVKKATRAAEAEARAANAPAEAIKAAGDAAAELVKTAALEALKNTNDEEAAVLAASEAASTVVDAAMAIEVSRSSKDVNADSSSSKAFEPEVDEELEEFFVLDDESLAQLREKYCIQCLVILGEYVEVLGPVLHEKGVDVCLALLQRSSKQKESSETFILLPDVLKLICALAAHRKFAALFVDRGGMQKFLAVQRDSQTFFGLSSCLLTIGSLQGIMERVCALPSDVVHQVVELALQLLECPQDPARKNAAIFFASAFVFRAVLDSFDAQDGLQKMLNLLHGAASVRSGSNSGTLGPSNLGSLRNDRSPAEVLTASEKQIAYHTCVALRQYFRAHLLLLVDSLRPNKSNRSGARNVSSARAAYKPLDISNEAMEAVFVQIQRDRKLGPLFVRARWPAVDKFLASNGHIIMLELCQAPPDERYLHDLAQYALGVLHIVTLFPSSRKLIVNATLSNERVGMAVILDAANGAGYVDPEVGKKLSELIRDSGSQVSGTEQGRWQAELAQVAIELIAIVTNSGRASTLAATDAAAPTLRRIERAAIAAATPISYHSRELLLLIHEHLQASGLTTTATSLLKEAQLTPLPSLASPHPLPYQASVQETSSLQIQWPSGRAPCEFLSDASKITPRDENTNVRNDLTVSCSKKKPLVFSSSVSSQGKSQLSSQPSSVVKLSSASKNPSAAVGTSENPASSVFRPNSDTDLPFKTPIVLPLKRKLMDRDNGCASPVSMKRLATADVGFQSPVCQTPNTARKSSQPMDGVGISVTPSSNLRDPFGRSTPCCILVDNLDDVQYNSTPGGQMTPSAFQLGLVADPQAGNIERVTLDSLVVQYLKHQHRQCPAPITTLPPLSLLHPHVCPEPSRNFDAPTNVTSRLSMREFRNLYGGIRGHRKDRQFVYSRFRPWRTCRDDVAPLSCITFLGDFTRIATGSHSGELKIFDSNSGNVLENHSCCQSPITLLQSALSGDTQLLLSSGAHDVRLWDAYSVSGGPMHSFERCKSARFSHSGAMFAALSAEAEPSRREVLLYDIQTCNLELKLSDTSTTPAGTVRGHAQSLIHFSPSDTMLLWNGVLWDRRVSRSVHRFDQFTDYGGGGFHPAGNEVIINSEVWDLRKFKLLRSVPSLDQTVITFNGAGDVIYAILRRNLEDIASAVHTRRVRHPLFAAFRTVDAVTYTDIATIPVDRCVLDFAVEPTDSFVGLVSMDDHDDLFSSARLYEIGRRRPTNDDSDPDDGVDTDDEDDEDDDSEADEDPTLGLDLDSNIDSDAEDLSNDDDDDSADELDDDDGDFNIDDVGFEGGPGILEIMTEGDDDDDSQVVDSFSSEDEGDYSGHGFGF
ncbi:DDB1- and CUL4-associated factor homolog 1 isoform X5 [Magnolia sinica]|uniref:DDB1- and CUL4-associated factor homolog 1 isoform X5 n=1 Tax=Magnolia sinica TaxID=86752 RepID=UPI00265A9E1E|nr:DDB1- and CUL4-associated factor homolog 1 isoform X5 [Magnolia sinica]